MVYCPIFQKYFCRFDLLHCFYFSSEFKFFTLGLEHEKNFNWTRYLNLLIVLELDELDLGLECKLKLDRSLRDRSEITSYLGEGRDAKCQCWEILWNILKSRWNFPMCFIYIVKIIMSIYYFQRQFFSCYC